MFLFKNTKNLVKRIIMNVAVYGWIGVLVIMLLSIILPSSFHQIFYSLMVISSFSALIGTVVSIVWSIVEFFANILSENKGIKPTATEAIYPVTSSKVENKAFTFETFKVQSSVPEDKSDANYQARMDFERGGSPSFESSLGNRGMFTCSNCHNVLPQKYLHSNGICSSCATELNSQIINHVKSSYTDIKLGEKFDGGFTEYYISLRKDIKGYCIYENSWHYNAGIETHISTKYLDDSQIKSFSFDSFIRFIKSQCPNYEIDRYTENNAELLRIFKKEKNCESEIGAETSQENQKQNKNIWLFYYKKNESEWYQIELQFNENDEISIIDTYYWPAVRGGSNGGQTIFKLDSDYFTKNSIDDFIAFLTNKYKLVKQFNQDFSNLKHRDDIKALFKNSNTPSNSTIKNIYFSKFNIVDGNLIDKKSGSTLIKEVVLDDNTDKQIMKVENYVENYIEATLKKGEYKGYQYPQSKSGMSCKECGKHLRAFHYYRNNFCWTYCEECGKPNHASHAAPYKTIELMFSGNQERGYGLAIEIENWPSLVCGSLRYEEWECLGTFCGGYGADRVDLPSNYIVEHTVDEFIDDYILKDNKAINHISNFINEEFLNMTRTILMESGIFKQPTQAAIAEMK